MKKWPSKRRIKARLRLGREVSMMQLIYHDMDSEETICKYNLHLDFNREVVIRLAVGRL